MSYIVGSAMQLIGTQILSGTAATVTFSSIPQNFNHLRLVIMARSNVAAGAANVKYVLNADSGANYDYQYITGSNATIAAGAGVGSTLNFIGSVTAATATANYAGVIESMFFGYKSTTFYKTLKSSSSYNTASAPNSQTLELVNTWRNTAAITTIAVTDNSGGSFIIGSSFYLYGVL